MTREQAVKLEKLQIELRRQIAEKATFEDMQRKLGEELSRLEREEKERRIREEELNRRRAAEEEKRRLASERQLREEIEQSIRDELERRFRSEMERVKTEAEEKVLQEADRAARRQAELLANEHLEKLRREAEEKHRIEEEERRTREAIEREAREKEMRLQLEETERKLRSELEQALALAGSSKDEIPGFDGNGAVHGAAVGERPADASDEHAQEAISHAEAVDMLIRESCAETSAGVSFDPSSITPAVSDAECASVENHPDGGERETLLSDRDGFDPAIAKILDSFQEQLATAPVAVREAAVAPVPGKTDSSIGAAGFPAAVTSRRWPQDSCNDEAVTNGAHGKKNHPVPPSDFSNHYYSNTWKTGIRVGLAVVIISLIALILFNNRGNFASGGGELRIRCAPEQVRLFQDLVKAWLEKDGAASVKEASSGGTVTVSADMGGDSARTIEIESSRIDRVFAGQSAGKTDLIAATGLVQADEAFLHEHPDLYQGEHVLAVDGICVLVNSKNPLRSMSTANLRAVISGAVGDWSALKLPKHRIALVLPAESGLSGLMLRQVLPVGNGGPSGAEVLNDDSSIAAAVVRNPHALGFVRRSALPRRRSAPPAGAAFLSIGDPDNLMFAPTEDALSLETYPLTARCMLYALPSADSRYTADFLRFVTGNEGQEIVNTHGFADQRPRLLANAPAPPDLRRLSLLPAGSKRFACDIRLRKGTSETDPRGRDDIKRIAEFVRARFGAAARLTVLGYSDRMGAAGSEELASLTQARKVAELLRQAGISAVRAHALGASKPIASDNLDEGRNRNRRVEIWISP